ncbi:MAG: hypothetical protein WA989_02290 [Henriciella sp.]|uniref:hypothetical protein n=1 Tax=Henriciella sp. TaxID=1968823 RepID=UPI003C75BD8E
MFDARNVSEKSGGGLVFGLLTIALVSALFFGVLFFPSLTGPGKSEVPGMAETPASTSLAAAFDDQPTLDYIQKLRATFPSAATDLERTLERASARGADKVELGLLVLQAGHQEIAGSIDRLAKADVRYFNQILDLSVEGLNDLSSSGAPYCKGSDLITFASLSDQQLYAAAFDRVGHGAGLYNYGLEMNGVILDAIRAARANPRNYSRLTSADERAAQTLAFSLMTDPQIMKLLTLEGTSRAQMDEAMRDVNFCDLGVSIIRKVDALPEDTKGRLWGELWRQVDRDGIERMFYRYAY